MRSILLFSITLGLSLGILRAQDSFLVEQQKALGVYDAIHAYQVAPEEQKRALFPAYREAQLIFKFGSKEAYEAHQADRVILKKVLYNIGEVIRAREDVETIKAGLDSPSLPASAMEQLDKVRADGKAFMDAMRTKLLHVAPSEQLYALEEEATGIVKKYATLPSEGFGIVGVAAPLQIDDLKKPGAQEAVEKFCQKLADELPKLPQWTDQQLAAEFVLLQDELEDH